MTEFTAIDEKLVNALNSATKYIENSILALNNKNMNLLADDLWHVAAELEYALFLFLIVLSDESNIIKKPNSLPEKSNALTLINIRKLLEEAKSLVSAKNLSEAYERTYIARNQVLKFSEDLTKKKRETTKKE